MQGRTHLHVCMQFYRCTTRGGMTTFDKREEGFEKQFAHDEELRFKAVARRNKMLGLWAAGDNDVLRKVAKDLQPKGVTEQQIRTQMTELLTQAVEQIKKSG